jgi:uncharacterized phage-associated protein
LHGSSDISDFLQKPPCPAEADVMKNVVMTTATNQNTSLELANALLMKAREASIPVSASTLQQLVYLASGWNLAINNRLLILDLPEAWPIGATYRRLFQALQRHGDKPVPDLVQFGDDLPIDKPTTGVPAIGYFTHQEYAVIDKIWSTYGSYDSEDLVRLTQGPDTPYAQFFASGRSVLLPLDAVRAYFVSLAKAARDRGAPGA